MTVEQIAGAALMVLFPTDIFLTVLYARAGTGLLAPRWNRPVWASIGSVAGLFGSRRSIALSFAGPLIVVALIGFWAILVNGATAVIHHARRSGKASRWLAELLRRKPPKLAAVALANKTARIAWKLMVSGETYSAQSGPTLKGCAT
jgi:hypothetical protein